MLKALEESPVEGFNKPDPIFTNKIILNGRYYPQKGSTEDIHTILYYVDRLDPLASSFPTQPQLDSQFDNWEWAVRRHYNLSY